MSHINNAASSSPIPGTVVLNVTFISSVDSPYTVLPTDDFIGVGTNTGPVTVLLPDAPLVGRTYIIKDTTSNASTNNITVTTVSGTDDIDGAATTVMNTDYESLEFIYGGSSKYYIY